MITINSIIVKPLWFRGILASSNPIPTPHTVLEYVPINKSYLSNPQKHRKRFLGFITTWLLVLYKRFPL